MNDTVHCRYSNRKDNENRIDVFFFFSNDKNKNKNNFFFVIVISVLNIVGDFFSFVIDRHKHRWHFIKTNKSFTINLNITE